MSCQKSEVLEKIEIQFSSEDDGASEVVAINTKREELAEVKLFENPVSVSIISDNTANAEELYIDIGEQVTPKVHGCINSIEGCTSNRQSMYMFICCLHHSSNMRFEGTSFLQILFALVFL